MIAQFDNMESLATYIADKLGTGYSVYLKHGQTGLTLMIHEGTTIGGRQAGLMYPLSIAGNPKGVRVFSACALVPLTGYANDNDVFQRVRSLDATVLELLQERRHPEDQTGEHDLRELSAPPS
ncbi:MAG: hypothetical protein ABIH21_01245 [Patescibacteria group bacterium]